MSSEFRKDPILDRWVIISPSRSERPIQFRDEEVPQGDADCPFCLGRENETPEEILVYSDDPHRQPNTSGWKTRVVPNKFPALSKGQLKRRGNGIYDFINGIGVHEVLIETPDHALELADLPIDHVEAVIWTYYYRARMLRDDHQLRYTMIFKNKGAAAGASLEHPHSQLIAMPIVPKRVMEELDGAQRHYHQKERCIYCDIINQELQDQSRVIMENPYFVALAPFAPRFPYETWILPKDHQSHFEQDPTQRYLADLASILKETLTRINRLLQYPPYNYMIHSAPLNEPELAYYHWHLEIIPKLAKAAGFEWGTGFHINSVSPEDAAQRLREVAL
ncbi:MAG: galactose-1-phosphate uridylyltransferase [Gemmatimonadetes bacterium]|nr:MAG: galactose-1-phosphate uridylyltransferase [Gemmatimonadota bacterium]